MTIPLFFYFVMCSRNASNFRSSSYRFVNKASFALYILAFLECLARKEEETKVNDSIDFLMIVAVYPLYVPPACSGEKETHAAGHLGARAMPPPRRATACPPHRGYDDGSGWLGRPFRAPVVRRSRRCLGSFRVFSRLTPLRVRISAIILKVTSSRKRVRKGAE